ncbi:MAG TPA: hypothetical protein VFI76_10100 [Terrimicrobiaceae bacterium]|nr:hypothetical protein [Terrimicrobiaceae bacterium]
MKKLLCMTAAVLLAAALPAKADTVAIGTFTSDHCTNNCGPQTGGFATITATDNGAGTIGIVIDLLNGNTFANGGQDVVFGFNLVGNPTITYSGLSSAFSIPGVIPINQQNAGTLSADGFGTFEYGIEGTFTGASNISSLSFSISGAGLSLASFAERSTIPPGDLAVFMALDIFSGTTGNTGFVDLNNGGRPTPFDVPPVPLPPAVWLFGTGLVGLYLAGKRRKANALKMAAA